MGAALNALKKIGDKIQRRWITTGAMLKY